MGERRRTREGQRWRRPALAAAGGVVVLVAGGIAVSGATGADDQSVAQLRAWPIVAPALAVPVDAPADGGAATDAPAAPADGADRSPATATATTPEKAPDTLPSGAPTDAQVNAELRRSLKSSGGQSPSDETLISGASLNADGTATIPIDAPGKVADIIRAGNQVARKPYVYGGGHGRLAGSTWIDTAYDCSGSISFALAAAGIIDAPMTSGGLADWGEPGPGKWVTIYANAGHTFMYVAGLRFDTSGRQTTGSRWQTASRGTSGFRVVHPKGL